MRFQTLINDLTDELSAGFRPQALDSKVECLTKRGGNQSLFDSVLLEPLVHALAPRRAKQFVQLAAKAGAKLA